MAKEERNTPLFIAAVFTLTIIILSAVFSGDFRIKALNVFRMPLKVISGIVYTLRDIARFSDIKNEDTLLRENIINLEKELLHVQEERLENKRLRELLNLKDAYGHKFIPACVIGKDPLELKDTIIIDRGKKDKIDRDMLVVSGNGLVGRIIEVGWSISRVLLITDYDSVFSGIAERSREEGAVVGARRQGIIMKYLSVGCDVQKGDKVITSGLYGVFEKGILIGEVASVENDASGLYVNAVVKPEVDVSKLETVLVMR